MHVLAPFRAGFYWTEVFHHYAALQPDATAVIGVESRLTWRQLLARTNRAANLLGALGLQKNDKVALLMHSSVAMFEALWGALRNGHVAVPFSPLLPDETVARLIDDSDALVLVADAATREQVERIRPRLAKMARGRFLASGFEGPGWESLEKLMEGASEKAPGVEVSLDDTMMIVYSSGTTGVPKGIEISHGARIAYSIGLGARVQYERTAVTICSTPLYSNGTYMLMLPSLYFGGTLVLMPAFDARRFLEIVERERGTHAFMVPLQFRAILDAQLSAKSDLGSLRALITAGQPLPTQTREDLARAIPQAGLYEVYGFSEAFGTLNTPHDAARGKLASVGRSFFFDDVRIVDGQGAEVARTERGEIVVHGPSLMKGYYNDPERTKASTWRSPDGRDFLRSGDVGYLDAEGYLYISGRIKETIKSGGINVYAVDIEDVFMKHPAVQEAVAIGIPDDKWGETPLVLLIPQPGSQVTESELCEWANERLAKFQRVARVEFRSDFPRGAYGKPQRLELRKAYWPQN